MATTLLAACAPLDAADPGAPSRDSENPEAVTSSSHAALAEPITFRGSSVSALDQAGAASISVARPSGTVAGDVEIAVVATQSGITVTPPDGFRLVTSQVDTGSAVAGQGVGTSVFVRVAGPNEPASYRFGLSGRTRAVASILAYANVDAANPIDAVASASERATATQHRTPSIATTRDGAVLMGIYGMLSPRHPASATSTMSHERVDRSAGAAGSWAVHLAVYGSNPKTGPASESGRTAVSSAATDTATMTLLALRPKAAPAARTLFGAGFSPHNEAYYDRLIDLFGGMGVSRSFDGQRGVGPFLNTYQAQDVERGVASAYSFKYPPAEVIAGRHDAALRGFFEGIRDGHPVYWTYWHEPDDELYKNRVFTPADYRAAWRHIKDIANEVKASRPALTIYATLIIMEYSMTPKVAPSRPLLGPDGMYPGDDVIDVFGVDVYNTGAPKGKMDDPVQTYGKVIDFAQAHGKPWAIGELGSCAVAGDPGGRARFLSDSFSYWAERDYPPVYVAYFNLDWSDKTCDYRLDNDPAALEVWREAVENGIDAFD
ncbi:glycoside hydrolase family 26 protein [Sorangium sp. So ce513]|uniref:glycoside hydrolase family 26 protein n=1 Tax=Sorangium sp. So ce513 TaxID=3133315 RepID=UPI003F60A6CB